MLVCETSKLPPWQPHHTSLREPLQREPSQVEGVGTFQAGSNPSVRQVAKKSLRRPDSWFNISRKKSACVNISKSGGALTLREISYPSGEVALLRAITQGEALTILEKMRPEILVFDSDTLTSEPLEFLSALHARDIHVRVGCAVERDRLLSRMGKEIWCTSKRASPDAAPPPQWGSRRFTVGDYIDLAAFHRCSVKLIFNTENRKPSEVTLYLGKIWREDRESSAILAHQVPISMSFRTIICTANNKTQSLGSIQKESMRSLDLKNLSEVDGFIAACLVDSESGMVLGAHDGGPDFNIEVAAAGNAEVIKAKRRNMKALNLTDGIEDILVTLGNQYHLFRPLTKNPAYFLYLALDRGRANLALARNEMKAFDAIVKLK